MASRRGVGRTEVIIGVAVVVILAVILIPLWMGTSKKSARAEVPLIVDSIRTAEVTYMEAFDEYVSAEAAPRPFTAVGDEPVPWEPTPGFVKLAWEPDQEELYGAYGVVAKADGFTVTGTCDVDGDGERAIYTATEESNAAMQTDADVY